MIREILAQQEFQFGREDGDARGMALASVRMELLDACTRLVDLLDSPEDIPFLSRLIEREIIYRLLRSPQGQHLRAIATLGEQSHRTAKVVSWLRMNYCQAAAGGRAGSHGANGRVDVASSISLAHGHEPTAVSEAGSAARGARTDDQRRAGCRQRGI